MTFSPISYVESLRIGSVDFVSPNEIKVLLDVEAPNNVALNAGVPRPFPRVNEYALIPTESGLLVAQIEWITIERSQYPKRRGVQDFGILDLPYPLRKMSLNPLGLLKEKREGDKTSYLFSRGVERFPSVGDPVLTPTPDQLRAIVESGENRNVALGVSPLADGASVKVDPDRLFGRHLAILGSTGSGKSCSVAGAIRWSIEAAQGEIAKPEETKEQGKTKEQAERQKQEKTNTQKPANARFIVLDPNGEYTSTFSGLPGVRVYGAEEDKSRGINQLRVPIWLWNGDEWAAFAQASEKTQRPTLIQALRSVRDSQTIRAHESPYDDLRYCLDCMLPFIRDEVASKTLFCDGKRGRNFQTSLDACLSDLKKFTNNKYSDELIDTIKRFKKESVNGSEWPHYPPLSQQVLLNVLEKVNNELTSNESPSNVSNSLDFFQVEKLFSSIRETAIKLGTSQYVEPMLLRIHTLLSDAKLKNVIASDGADSMKLHDWLNAYVCPSGAASPSITVIDLSLLPAELTHIIAAVVARLTLEALQRYRKLHNGQTLPTTLVMEEAHSFIKRYNDDGENVSASKACAQVFEKIAREGRKFGLGLVLSSQRPSELSPTVLSQCNTFLLHRLTSDRDQELVAKLVPDSLRGLLRDLPSLPSQHAILLGWAAETPTLVRMNDLAADQRPKSDDPNYWAVWTGAERNVDWKTVAQDWQGVADEPEPPSK
ncbi:MAG: DUF87 domain-containing protein [Thermoguttaceae bacterium]|nr:DUF87 domain-containing protein [Thermoguttaceae bacterium]